MKTDMQLVASEKVISQSVRSKLIVSINLKLKSRKYKIKGETSFIGILGSKKIVDCWTLTGTHWLPLVFMNACLNHWTLMSDQDWISPYNTYAESSRQVMRIK